MFSISKSIISILLLVPLLVPLLAPLLLLPQIGMRIPPLMTPISRQIDLPTPDCSTSILLSISCLSFLYFGLLNRK